jgi:hypothetical protein
VFGLQDVEHCVTGAHLTIAEQDGDVHASIRADKRAARDDEGPTVAE